MHNIRAYAVAVATAFLIGCASAPEPEAPAFDLAGIYTFSTLVQGSPVEGQMRILGEPGNYEGSMYSEVTGELSFTSITRTGTAVTLLAETPDGPVGINLVFDGDRFTGDWTLGLDGGSIQGRKVR